MCKNCRELSDLLFEMIELVECGSGGIRSVEHYGSCLVDDPRDFEPDEEVCSEEEINAWKQACKDEEEGKTVNAPKHIMTATTHVAINTWGIGINKFDSQKQWKKLAQRATKKINEMNGMLEIDNT